MATNSSVVHTGVWRDHDVSSFYSPRITLLNRDGRFLRSALVILVAFAGNRLWTFVAFLLHRWGAQGRRGHSMDANVSNKEGNLNLREGQVILRNSETPSGAATGIGLSMLSGSKTGGCKTPKVTFSLTAATYAVLFVVAGLLTSFVDIGSTVLSRKTKACGFWETSRSQSNVLSNAPSNTPSDFVDKGSVAMGFYLNATYDAETYIQNCFSPDGKFKPSAYGCTGLHVSDIAYTKSKAKCPFVDRRINACSERWADDGLAIETEKVSFSHLGLNSESFSKLHFQRRVECSPIDSRPFRYNPGQILNEKDDIAIGNKLNRIIYSETNMTDYLGAFAVSRFNSRNLTHYYFDMKLETGNLPYTLYVDEISSAGQFNISCIPPLCVPHKSMWLSIFTVHAPGTFFPQRINDAFFQTEPVPIFDTMTLTERRNPANDRYKKLWKASFAINTVACFEMVRYCSDITGRCTAWTGFSGNHPDEAEDRVEGLYNIATTLFPEDNLPFNNLTTSALAYVTAQVGSSSLASLLHLRGASAMRASRNIFGDIQYGYSDDHWKIEIEQWFHTAMIRILRSPVRLISTVERDIGPLGIQNERDKKQEEFMNALCSIVRFKSPDHTTYSLAGVVIIVVGVVVCTILSFVPMLWVYLMGRKGKILLWTNDEAVELLRESWKAADASPISAGSEAKGYEAKGAYTYAQVPQHRTLEDID